MISNLELSSELREQLIAAGMPSKVVMLVDVVDWLRESRGIHVEVILSGEHMGKARDEEYIIRVSDDTGGNVSKFSSDTYKVCLASGVEMALRIFF